MGERRRRVRGIERSIFLFAFHLLPLHTYSHTTPTSLEVLIVEFNKNRHPLASQCHARRGSGEGANDNKANAKESSEKPKQGSRVKIVRGGIQQILFHR